MFETRGGLWVWVEVHRSLLWRLVKNVCKSIEGGWTVVDVHESEWKPSRESILRTLVASISKTLVSLWNTEEIRCGNTLLAYVREIRRGRSKSVDA